MRRTDYAQFNIFTCSWRSMKRSVFGYHREDMDLFLILIRQLNLYTTSLFCFKYFKLPSFTFCVYCNHIFWCSYTPSPFLNKKYENTLKNELTTTNIFASNCGLQFSGHPTKGGQGGMAPPLFSK